MTKNAIRETTIDSQKLCLMHLDELRVKNQERLQNTNDMLIFIVIFVFLAAVLVFLSLPDLRGDPLNSIYVEMSIFLFTVIVGFTVSRQNNRYRQIIEEITAFDGSVSAMYREFAYFGDEYQDEFKQFALNHYEPVISLHQWDYNIVNKSNTLRKTYDLVQRGLEDQQLAHIEHSAVSEIKKQLAGMQKNRKDMIALHAERIPSFQWFIMIFLSMMLIITIASVSSYGHFVESLLKGSFATAIIATLIMLRKLDTLDLFESFLGEHSAQDVIDIFDGKK